MLKQVQHDGIQWMLNRVQHDRIQWMLKQVQHDNTFGSAPMTILIRQPRQPGVKGRVFVVFCLQKIRAFARKQKLGKQALLAAIGRKDQVFVVFCLQKIRAFARKQKLGKQAPLAAIRRRGQIENQSPVAKNAVNNKSVQYEKYFFEILYAFGSGRADGLPWRG